jgi:hypothetical protein
MLLFVSTASASPVIVGEPTILGPPSSVHDVPGEGYDGNTLYWVLTRGLEAPEVNAALWEATFPEGIYQVEAWIPLKEGYTYARYDMVHSRQSSEVRLHQADFGNEWVTLGTYAFDGSEASVRSTDAAGYPEEQLAWDAMRWTPVSAIPPNIETQEGVTTVIEPQVSGPEEFVVHFVGVGYHGHLLRVYARGAGETPVNSATWTAPLAAGEYAVEAFIPNEHAEAEVGYTVHAYTGETTVEVHQKSYSNLWVKLGDFSFGDEGGTVTTNDATGIKKEEIAWDALRFTEISPVSKTEERPSTSGTSEGPPTGTPRSPVPAEPVVPEQDGLIAFVPHGLYLGRKGARVAGTHVYTIRALYPVPRSLTLSYRCLPCVIVTTPLRLRPHSRIPVTHTSHAQGDLRKLVGKAWLYKGTQLQVEVSEHGYRPRRYLYRLPGSGSVPAPMECTAATPASVKGCAP